MLPCALLSLVPQPLLQVLGMVLEQKGRKKWHLLKDRGESDKPKE